MLKHIPQRTCIVTRQKCNKKSLIRFVLEKNIDKRIIKIDQKQEISSKGIYILPDIKVFDEAIKKKKLEFAFKLKNKIDSNDIETLRNEFENVIKNFNNQVI